MKIDHPQNKTILLISPEPWSHIFVSKHHYATHLAARGNRVYFLNPPTNSQTQVKPTDYRNVFEIDYDGFIKGLRFLPKSIQRKVILNKFNQLERLCETKFDVVWSFDNSVFFDFDALPESVLKISHIVDLNQDFQTARAASTADICFGATRFIIDRLIKHNPNTHFINHGFHGLFGDEKVDLPGDNEVKAFYAGNLDIVYLDWGILDKLVAEHPNIDFVFAGKMQKGNRLFERPNVFYLGIVPSDQLAAMYRQADVLLLCYKAEQFHEQLANPHKMMEYLASGKVVVATKTEEYQHLAGEGVIAMADENHGFSMLFRDVLNNLDHWNSQGLQERRIVFAEENTYDKQIDRIEFLIQNNGR